MKAESYTNGRKPRERDAVLCVSGNVNDGECRIATFRAGQLRIGKSPISTPKQAWHMDDVQVALATLPKKQVRPSKGILYANGRRARDGDTVLFETEAGGKFIVGSTDGSSLYAAVPKRRRSTLCFDRSYVGVCFASPGRSWHIEDVLTALATIRAGDAV